MDLMQGTGREIAGEAGERAELRATLPGRPPPLGTAVRVVKREAVERGGTFEGRLGDAAGPPVPSDAERFRFTVGDPEGMGCETAVWILRALHRLDASVWVEHAEAGSLQIAARGRGTPGRRMLWTSFYRGTELVVAATGPEAREALEACRELVAVPPDERKALYRGRHAGRSRRRVCKVCEYPHREMLDEVLDAGTSPRSLRADYPDLSRTEITAHRDGCRGRRREETS